MRYLIIDASPRAKRESTTSLVADSFANGLREKDHAVAIMELRRRNQWEKLTLEIPHSDGVIIAMPLYVENMPGLLLEYLQSLSLGALTGVALGYIIQGGFGEAHQLRCCETYCKIASQQLDADYIGCAVKGDMFGLATMRGDRYSRNMLERFHQLGRQFGSCGSFLDMDVGKLAGGEYYSKPILLLNKALKPLSKLAWNAIGKKAGAKAPLDAQPLLENRERRP